jgi:predicted CXXCH cytochrome family protein
LVFVLVGFWGAAAVAADYVGSTACASCHAEASDAWSASDHAQAWTLPGPTTVLGDFSGVVFEHGGKTTRFLRDGAKFLIETDGPDGQRRAFEVVGVAGVDPLQQYLLSPEPGRTQTYDIAWDVQGKRWYPVFPDQVVPADDGMHWTGPYKSWESRCAECHATGYSRNYQPQTNRFVPRMAERSVGCEACHGPGSDHLDWAHRASAREPASDPGAMGLTIDLSESQQTEVMQCLTCHSRREAMQDGNPLPGSSYHDAFSMTLLRQGLYHPDGSILDEVFEGGSFLQSKMNARGVRCSNCHEPHSASLRAEGNAVCTQCHSPAGNPQFPTLPLKVYDGAEHHFHPEDSLGTQCVSCHMIERTYMGIDTRRDHSFRVPRPDLAATGSPDACTDCHQERDATWAAAELAARFPDSPHRGPHYATAFAAAHNDPQAAAGDLLDIAEWRDGPAIVRATALDLLGATGDMTTARRVIRLLSDPDPLVRGAAASALRGMPAEDRLAALTHLLSDTQRAVREAAAKALLDLRPEVATPAAAALVAAQKEWWSALQLRADFPETQLQIGGAALQARQFPLAVRAFTQAVALDPQIVEAWVMLIRLHAAMGNPDAARAALSSALAANPASPELRSMQGSVAP